MTRKVLWAALLASIPPAALLGQGAAPAPAVRTVTLPSPGSPLVAVQLQFEVGSIDDPAGKEGLAALTGMMLTSAGTSERSYAELVDALYPMAASIDVGTDRELTVISGMVHVDTLPAYTALLTEAVLSPGFAASDFARNKEQLEAYLTNTLRATNDELLGLEALQQVLFAGHPYEHSPAGTVQGLAAIGLDDVEAFYASHFTRARLTVGVAGGHPEGYPASLAATLAALPVGGEAARPAAPEPARPEGRSFTLIAKKTDSVGIHFGHPLPLTRADADYYPLMVANSYLGEHRTFHGRLMQQLRGERGLNYGDYSYVEHWEAPPFTSAPSPGVARRRQYFSVWIRPVQPPTAHFALRAGLYEVDRLIERGLTAEELDLTRAFLVNYSKLWAQTLPDRLGFLMDSEYLGMPYWIDEIETRLAALDLETVNAAVRKYLSTDAYEAVLVTDDAETVKAWLEADEPSPIEYNAAKPEAILEADKAIQARKVAPTSVTIAPVGAMFEGEAAPE